MMKKVDKKKIILSVLLSSMLWSNSLYAYELSENVLSGDIIEDELENDKSFEIVGSGPFKLANNQKLTLNIVTDGVVGFTNVKNVIDSNFQGELYGGYEENTNGNQVTISNSTLNYVYGSAFGDINSNNSITASGGSIENIFGGFCNQIGSEKTSVAANSNHIIAEETLIDTVVGGSTGVSSTTGFESNLKNVEANENIIELKYIDNSSNSDSDSDKITALRGGNVQASYAGVNGTVELLDASDNELQISNSYIKLKKDASLMGGIVGIWRTGNLTGDIKANQNTVILRDSQISPTKDIDIVGGIIIDNKIDGYVGNASADYNYVGNASADYNKVEIDGSNIEGNIIGGKNEIGQANYNSVIIKNGSFVEGDIVAGWAENNIVKGNSIEINGDNNLMQGDLVGYIGESEDITHSDNKLIINDFSSAIQSVTSFDKIVFNDVQWNINPEVVVKTDKFGKEYYSGNGGIYVLNDISNIGNIEIANIGKTDLKVGDRTYLIFATQGDEISKFDERNVENYSGVAKVVSLKMDYEEPKHIDGINTELPALSAVVTGVERNKQVDLVASNRAVAAAFVNQGTDLIADSLDTLSRDGKYGVKTFAAVHGNRSKYDVNNDIKINGWSTIVGVGAENEHNGGDFSWGVFYENGSGNYRTYNDFNNEFFRGDGSLVYNGGGIAARYENSHGVYTEGSLRAGMLKSEMTDALSDGENKYGYESETAYYGAHIGVGKIFSLGDDSDLDVYGKFFHTYTEGDSFNVAGDEFEFDSINSDRLRIGARVTSNKENKFSTYYGLAYEYEFNGDAEMRAAGMKAPTQSLQGSSVMAEIGLNYQPTPDSPWSFDLNMRGYAGERQGGSFNVQATYTF